MRFEVTLPAKLEFWALHRAGVDSRESLDRHMDLFLKNEPLVWEVASRYFLSDDPLEVRIRRTPEGCDAHLVFDIDSEQTGSQIRDFVDRYSVENDGEAVFWQEHERLFAHIREALDREGVSSEGFFRGKAVLNRGAIEALMRLYDETERFRKRELANLFSQGRVARGDKAFVAPWLIKAYEVENGWDGDLALRIDEMAVPKIADDLIRLIENRRFGPTRGPLCSALAKTRDRRAADVIVTVIDEEHMAGWCLDALGRLRATEHLRTVRRFVHDPEPYVRRQAKRTLKKLGFPLETPPPPVHVVKGRSRPPLDATEWGVSLDIEDVVPTLEKLAACVEQGFGPTEVAEVAGVVDEMRLDQTKWFRFTVVAGGEATEMWVSVFLDDVSSPDLDVFATPAIVEPFSSAVMASLAPPPA